ncbi:hypothetical protein FAVG1_13189 [Fusarium avenaceum]|nr:hypothetical protein FAVG1_13189 [Fusarium avenaceum]
MIITNYQKALPPDCYYGCPGLLKDNKKTIQTQEWCSLLAEPPDDYKNCVKTLTHVKSLRPQVVHEYLQAVVEDPDTGNHICLIAGRQTAQDQVILGRWVSRSNSCMQETNNIYIQVKPKEYLAHKMAELLFDKQDFTIAKRKVVVVTEYQRFIYVHYDGRHQVGGEEELLVRFNRTRKAYGSIDHLFANAGIGPRADYLSKKLDESGDLIEPSRENLEVNLRGVMSIVTITIYHLRQQAEGRRILITASTTGLQRFRAVDYGTRSVIGLGRGLIQMLRAAKLLIRLVHVRRGKYAEIGDAILLTAIQGFRGCSSEDEDFGLSTAAAAVV